MTLLVTDSGETIALGYYLAKDLAPSDLIYHLYTNNITPAETDVAGTYVEAVGGGYVQKSLVGGNWTITPGAPTDGAGSGIVYGYFATRTSDGQLMHAESFTPFTPTNNGDQILLTPHVTCD
jgi:hypothetical protein